MLAIEIFVRPGNKPDKACREMVELATKLGIEVTTNINGVTCQAFPGHDPNTMAESFQKALKSGSTHACSI